MVSSLGDIGGTWFPDTVSQGVEVRKRDSTSTTTPLELVTESGGVDPNATSWGLYAVLGVGLIWLWSRR
jgi:hypothetical protein